MEEAMSIQDIQKIIKKRLLLIFTLIIVGAGIAAWISFYIQTPVYLAQSQILVNQNRSITNMYAAQRESELELIQTFNDIVTSEYLITKVINELELDVKPKKLSKQIIFLSEENSRVVTIKVLNEDPQLAVDIANTTVTLFKREIRSLMNLNNIDVLSPASLPMDIKPEKPNKPLNIAVGAVIGLFIAIGITFLLEVLDTTIKNEKDVDEFLDIPIMGIVGIIPLEKVKKSSYKSREVRGNNNAWIEN